MNPPPPPTPKREITGTLGHMFSSSTGGRLLGCCEELARRAAGRRPFRGLFIRFVFFHKPVLITGRWGGGDTQESIQEVHQRRRGRSCGCFFIIGRKLIAHRDMQAGMMPGSDTHAHAAAAAQDSTVRPPLPPRKALSLKCFSN